ncbi:MAG: polyribonucleotide nucleotidyltransferase [Elusimicrobia bacterium]|nr:polyribonucleotide nucleotidyltransferase [Elusimicrobiota bacterium]
MTKNKITRLEEKVGDSSITFETGHIARQASGSVVAKIGDTIVFSTCIQAKKPKPEPMDFVPLSVDFRERTYAAGKIPGGFFKREGRQREKEILASRLTDRSIRPLFSMAHNTEIQVVSMVVSADGVNDADIISINSASTALMISDIPFDGPIGAVRMGKINGKFVINPTYEQRAISDLELVISGTEKGILMVEGGGKEIPNSDLETAIEKSKPEIDKLCALQHKLRKLVGKPKREVIEPETSPEIVKFVEENVKPKIAELINSRPTKEALENGLGEITDAALKDAAEKFPEIGHASYLVKVLSKEIISNETRSLILKDKTRVDGRKCDEIRDISMTIGILPRAHGSALFTRGQTQALVTTTLGTPQDQQILDDLEGKTKESFMLHYNFPGYSTGETRPDRGPGRREIGHGALAKRALSPLLPSQEAFPYTLRIVSEIMESNGSSSMATVCGGSLSMFNAGVPMKAACAGIAMGLITQGSDYAILSDITGGEDHYGDMDFKLAGSKKGITAFQMDVKLATGIPLNILKEAIEQASKGRNHILGIMEENINQPNKEVSEFAPQIIKLKLPKDKIGAFIGPGGKNIRGIIEKTGAAIDVADDGTVSIASPDKTSLDAAKKMVEVFTIEVEIGQIYKGKVTGIVDFGAFVEVLPGKEGLLHISEIDSKRTNKVSDVLKMGDEVEVKVLNVEGNGKFKLSRRALL